MRQEAVRSQGETYKSQIGVAPLTLRLPGVVANGLRVSGTIAARPFAAKTRPPFYEDELGFAIGPAEIVLRAEGVPRPVPSSTEARLLTLLYSRAMRRKL
jgi:hypothetical protein